MTTTISTSSKNQFSKIRKYLTNKRIFFTPSINNGVYVLTIFELHNIEIDSLLNHQNDQTLPPLPKTAGAHGSCCLTFFSFNVTVTLK